MVRPGPRPRNPGAARREHQLIPAQTDATVVRIRVLPGTAVKPDTVSWIWPTRSSSRSWSVRSLALQEREADYKSLRPR